MADRIKRGEISGYIRTGDFNYGDIEWDESLQGRVSSNCSITINTFFRNKDYEFFSDYYYKKVLKKSAQNPCLFVDYQRHRCEQLIFK